jgi:hypothetical protein
MSTGAGEERALAELDSKESDQEAFT